MLVPDQPETRTRQERIGTWLGHLAAANPAARWLAAIIVPLLHPDPARRPRLDDVRAFLTGPERRPCLDDVRGAGPERPHARHVPPARPGAADVERMIVHATEHLLLTMGPDDSGRLWRPAAFTAATDPFSVHHGVAGVLGVLTRVHEARPDPALRDAVATVADWIAHNVPREPRALPGLHFGRSGTAWALLEAGRALGEEDLVRLAADLARRVPVSWPNPDVCHGVAGAGLTQLRFWEVTGDDGFLDRARRAACALTAAAELRDGRTVWPIARDFASMLAGLVH